MEPIYLDNHLLIVTKPAGILSQEDSTGDPDVLTQWKAWLKERYQKPGKVFLGLVHRLDRPASGVMVLARTSKAASRLSEQFRARSVTKEYLAILEGVPDLDGVLEDHLDKRKGHVRVVKVSDPRGKMARLTYRVVGKEGRHSLVGVRLETGRAHQIRVQFGSRGFPLLGDFRYGAKGEFDGRNLALHAHAITLLHPTLKEEMRFVSPVPNSWPRTFRVLADHKK